jgi:o-succinylbenzoate synthase
VAKKFSCEIKPYQLVFKEVAKTSRDEMSVRDIWTIKINDNFGRDGFGEIAPLKGLSLELNDMPKFEKKLAEVTRNIEYFIHNKLDLIEFPSILFGLESAWLSYKHRDFIFYNTPFTQQEKPIPFNALVWMGDSDKMSAQIDTILQKEVQCIKLKIGGIELDKELELLKYIRKYRSAETLQIRLDANGSFKPEEAQDKINLLSEYQIHSIEQPIFNILDSGFRVSESKIKIALDEELIGNHSYKEKWNLLDKIRPDYIVIKPSLHGGIVGSEEWIFIANQLKVKWWVTSALESNLGLNTIAQWVSKYDEAYQFPQGLGTGDLYENNFPTNLSTEDYNMYLRK